MLLLGYTWYTAKNSHRSSHPGGVFSCKMSLPHLQPGGGVYFSSPINLVWLCDFLWPKQCSTSDHVRVLSWGIKRLPSSHSCLLSWNFSCLTKKPRLSSWKMRGHQSPSHPSQAADACGCLSFHQLKNLKMLTISINANSFFFCY